MVVVVVDVVGDVQRDRAVEHGAGQRADRRVPRRRDLDVAGSAGKSGQSVGQRSGDMDGGRVRRGRGGIEGGRDHQGVDAARVRAGSGDCRGRDAVGGTVGGGGRGAHLSRRWHQRRLDAVGARWREPSATTVSGARTRCGTKSTSETRRQSRCLGLCAPMSCPQPAPHQTLAQSVPSVYLSHPQRDRKERERERERECEMGAAKGGVRNGTKLFWGLQGAKIPSLAKKRWPTHRTSRVVIVGAIHALSHGSLSRETETRQKRECKKERWRRKEGAAAGGDAIMGKAVDRLAT